MSPRGRPSTPPLGVLTRAPIRTAIRGAPVVPARQASHRPARGANGSPKSPSSSRCGSVLLGVAALISTRERRASRRHRRGASSPRPPSASRSAASTARLVDRDEPIPPAFPARATRVRDSRDRAAAAAGRLASPCARRSMRSSVSADLPELNRRRQRPGPLEVSAAPAPVAPGPARSWVARPIRCVVMEDERTSVFDAHPEAILATITSTSPSSP